MGHGQLAAEDLAVERGHDELARAVRQADGGLGVDAALGRQAERVGVDQLLGGGHCHALLCYSLYNRMAREVWLSLLKTIPHAIH